jgi:hypothetical protein
MFGPPNSGNFDRIHFDGSPVGLIPRAIQEIFQLSQHPEVLQFSVLCSFVQLYNENCYDMLRSVYPLLSPFLFSFTSLIYSPAHSSNLNKGIQQCHIHFLFVRRIKRFMSKDSQNISSRVSQRRCNSSGDSPHPHLLQRLTMRQGCRRASSNQRDEYESILLTKSFNLSGDSLVTHPADPL